MSNYQEIESQNIIEPIHVFEKNKAQKVANHYAGLYHVETDLAYTSLGLNTYIKPIIRGT